MKRWRSAVTVGVVVLAVVGCSSGQGERNDVVGRDAAGLTAGEVAGLSLEEEFEVAEGRYLELQSVLEDAQLRISDGTWKWSGGGRLPVGGGGGGGGFGAPLPGADDSNSYYLRVGRLLFPEGATGAVGSHQVWLKAR